MPHTTQLCHDSSEGKYLGISCIGLCVPPACGAAPSWQATLAMSHRSLHPDVSGAPTGCNGRC